jgi:hypothetical protein
MTVPKDPGVAAAEGPCSRDGYRSAPSISLACRSQAGSELASMGGRVAHPATTGARTLVGCARARLGASPSPVSPTSGSAALCRKKWLSALFRQCWGSHDQTRVGIRDRTAGGKFERASPG